MNADQARLARAAVKMGVREVAALAGVTPNTISRIERGGDARASDRKVGTGFRKNPMLQQKIRAKYAIPILRILL